jgi:hypothetical protein
MTKAYFQICLSQLAILRVHDLKLLTLPFRSYVIPEMLIQGMAPSLSAPSTHDCRLGLMLEPLATHHLVSSKVELSCYYLANPRDARSQQSADSFLLRCVSAYLSHGPHLVVLPCVPLCLSSRHFKTSRLL